MEVDGQETPCIAPPSAPAGTLTGRTIHFAPFHVSESGSATSKPTATQSVDDGHETPTSSPPSAGTFGVGVVWRVQVGLPAASPRATLATVPIATSTAASAKRLMIPSFHCGNFGPHVDHTYRIDLARQSPQPSLAGLPETPG